MPYEQLIDRVARTNAYPREHGLPDGWLGDDLEPDTQWSTIVATIQELKPTTETRPPGPNWGRIAAIVAVVVAIAVAAFILREDPDVVENVTTTTVAVDPAALQRALAEDVATFMYGGDVDALAGALVDSPDREDTLMFQATLIGSGATLLDVEGCELLEIGNRVRCTINFQDNVMRALDLEGAPRLVTLTFSDADSTDIDRIDVEPPSGFRLPVYADFLDWGFEN